VVRWHVDPSRGKLLKSGTSVFRGDGFCKDCGAALAATVIWPEPKNKIANPSNTTVTTLVGRARAGLPRIPPFSRRAVAIPTGHSAIEPRISVRGRICHAMVTREELDEAAERMDRARRELLAYMERSTATGFDDERQKLTDELKRSTEEYWSLVLQLR
jgi:hypothetical protein